MILTIPKTPEQVRDLIGKMYSTESGRKNNKNVKVIAELAGLGEEARTLRFEDLKNRIFDFVKPANSDTANKIYKLYQEAAERVETKKGKLMNGIGLFSTIGKYPNEESIVLVDPYWHSYLGMLMTSPEILKYVEQDQTKLGEILHVKEELRKNLNKCTSFYKLDKNRRGALKFFCARIFQLEYIARLCEINLEEFKLNFEEVGEISIKELIDIRNDIAENAESLEKYLANYLKHQKYS
ncbi:MAG: hypothetical protein ACTSYM_14005 [Candidatus Baldrarchaeia archaeon]